jgi:hypothetical protein
MFYFAALQRKSAQTRPVKPFATFTYFEEAP